MTKLLSANFTRLKKDTVFWLVMLCMAAGAVFFSYMNYQTSLRYDSDTRYVEEVLFNLLPMIAFVCAGFISLYLGTEFDDNTIRNKLVVGHTRTEVFCANYLTCMAASIALLLVILIFSGVTGYLLFKEFMMAWTELAYLCLCCILVTMVFSAISVTFAMNIHKKAICIVVAAVFMLVILYLASYMESVLSEPEMVYDGVTITMDGVQFGDLIENPAYVGDTTRKVLEWIYDMLPTGQAIQLNNMEFERCLRWPWLSVMMLAVATVSGYLPFRKRDIR